MLSLSRLKKQILQYFQNIGTFIRAPYVKYLYNLVRTDSTEEKRTDFYFCNSSIFIYCFYYCSHM